MAITSSLDDHYLLAVTSISNQTCFLSFMGMTPLNTVYSVRSLIVHVRV